MNLLIVAALFFAPAVQTQYLDLINMSKDSLLLFEISPAGSDEWRRFDMGMQPLQGGGASITVEFPREGTCVFDLRMEFRNGRKLLQPGYNVCRYPRYHLGVYRPLKAAYL